MKKEFNSIRQALEEHLSSINENTSEIQGLFDYLQEMSVKVEKLNQRIEELQLHHNPEEKRTVSPLNQIEKKLFLELYTEESPLCFKELAVRLQFPISVVQDGINSLVAKGIPLERSYFNDKPFLKLNPEFKERQAKENLINLSLNSFME